jgi:anti-anti-sigma factor
VSGTVGVRCGLCEHQPEAGQVWRSAARNPDDHTDSSLPLPTLPGAAAPRRVPTGVSFSEEVEGQDTVEAVGPGLRFGFDPASRRMTVAGELDSANADVLAELMATVLERDPGRVIMEISELDFVAAASRTSFLASCITINSAATSLTIVGASAATLRAGQALGLDVRPQGS